MRARVGGLAALAFLVTMAVVGAIGVEATGAASRGLAPPMIHAFCSDENHSGAPYQDPNGGPPLTDPLSVIPFGGSIDDLPPMESFFDVTFTIQAMGPSGELLSYEGPIIDQTLFQGILGINQGGNYQVTDFEVTGNGPDGPTSFSIAPDQFPDGGVMPVTFDTQQPCDATTVEPGTPAVAAPATTEATATTEPTSTTGSDGVTTAPPSTDIQIDLGDPPGESTFRQVFIIPMIIGGMLVIVGVAIYYRTRERPRPGATTTPPPGTPPGEESGPGSTPAVVPPPPVADQCDWAAYYDDGSRRHLLRAAQGEECCVYVVRMTSRIRNCDVTARGRQAPDALDGVADAPDGRLRLFDYDFRFSGLDLVSWASARSGPAGRLDWMQTGPAANWPRTPEARAPSGDYRPQLRIHEEEPDAAISLFYDEVNQLRISLESGCPDHRSTYTATGSGGSEVQVNAECTNRDPGPECPVELDAETGSSSTVSGDLNYTLVAETIGDRDELEGAAGLDVREVNGVTCHGSHVDSHDHDIRARQTYDVTTKGNGGPTVTNVDDFSLDVDNVAIHDAGMIVPARVWDSTDAVTTDVYVDFAHSITVDAAMTRTTCAAPGAGCCGHTRCLCAPELKVIFGGGAARIECDGNTFPLDRNNFGTMLGMAFGADSPWELG